MPKARDKDKVVDINGFCGDLRPYKPPFGGTPDIPNTKTSLEQPKQVQDSIVEKTEYYASKKFDSSRLSRDLKAEFIRQVIEEIVANLEGDTDEPLEITLDIKASNQHGFTQSTMRVISENAKTLGFDTSEFE